MFNLEQNCILCESVTQSKTSVCKDCELDLPHNINACPVCALSFLAQHQCPDCARLQPSFDRIFTPFSYVFPIDELIKQFKQQRKWHYGKALTLYLVQFLQQEWSTTNLRPDVLIPIPSTRSSMLERGFNQAHIMAKIMQRHLKVPISKNALIIHKNTPQKFLAADLRMQNLEQAFELKNKGNWHNLHVAIVDDVVTTGVTVNAGAKLLKKAGASRVDVYCLARTPFK